MSQEVLSLHKDVGQAAALFLPAGILNVASFFCSICRGRIPAEGHLCKSSFGGPRDDPHLSFFPSFFFPPSNTVFLFADSPIRPLGEDLEATGGRPFPQR